MTVEVYTDFQCPFCARAEPVLEQLADKYVNTGKVKLIHHNFTVIGPESETAAEAVECGGEQNLFWRFANNLFAHQGAENSGVFTPANVKVMAKAVGLNTSAFNACFDSGTSGRAAVAQSVAEGKQRGVQATPTFFVNGQRYEGAMPYDQMTRLIDAALAK